MQYLGSLLLHTSCGLFFYEKYKYMEMKIDQLQVMFKSFENNPELYPNELYSHFEKEGFKNKDTKSYKL
jgi:hypothetical protein